MDWTFQSAKPRNLHVVRAKQQNKQLCPAPHTTHYDKQHESNNVDENVTMALVTIYRADILLKLNASSD